jgi:integrase/recombinase XerD
MAIKKAVEYRGVTLSKPKGSKFYSMRWRNAAGQQVRRSTGTSDPALAKQIRDSLAEQLLRSRFNIEPTAKDFTPDDAWDFYIEHQSEVSERTLYHALSAWRRFWKVTGSPTLASVQPVDILRFQKLMQAEGRKPSYVNNIMRVVSSVYVKLVRWGELTCANPFAAVDRVKEGAPAPKYRPWPEVEAMLTVAKKQGDDIYLFCILCSHAGARHGEAIASRWEDVGWENGSFRIRGTKTRGSAATIPLHDALRAALWPYRKESGYIVANGTDAHPDPLRPHARWGYQSRWETLVKATGFKGSPHTLRHSFATHLLELGYDPVLLVKLMRHTNLAMTSHYANLLAVVPTMDRF